MYRVLWNWKIEEIEVKRRTAKFVIYYDEFWKKDERRSAVDFFDTRSTAAKNIIEKALARVNSAKDELARAEKTLASLTARLAEVLTD